MRLRGIFLALLAVLASRLIAQPIAPTTETVAALRGQALYPARAAAATPLSVDISSREEVRQFYRAIYSASENLPMEWTGSYTSGDPGLTSDAYKDAVALRINFFRALAGVPAGISLNSTFNAKAQQAALMMSANGELNHFPPSTWTFYTAAGAEAAGKSNLALGNAGANAITSLMEDGDGSGSLASIGHNAAVGHRRWLLYPQTREMGTGDVPGNNSLLPANATWVQDSFYGTTRPTTRTTGIAYPPSGFVPYTLVWPRWSFSYPDANFSNATVSMIRGGETISTQRENPQTGFAENTLVWVYDGQPTVGSTTHARPTADTTYAVTISNVVISGTPQTFTYNVTVFDPDIAGADFTPTTVLGPASPVVGASNSYTVVRQPFAGSFDWRVLSLAAGARSYNAENALDGVTTSTSPGYSVIEDGGGVHFYHLAQPAFEAQTVTLTDALLVTSASASLNFLSMLGWATPTQIALVQASTDDGSSWTEVYRQPGTGTSGESTFVSRNVSLASFINQAIRIRFRYEVSGSRYPQTTGGIGWYFDNVTITGVSTVTASAATPGSSASNFSYAPSAAGTVGLQARGVLFGAFPLGWGPVTQVTAAVGASFTTQPVSREASLNGSATFTVAATGNPTYQWQLNGTSIAGATNSSYTASNLQPSATGIYTARVTSNAGTATSQGAILGLTSTAKLIGPGTEFPDIFHAGTGFTYDQILLGGSAASVKADPGQILRISYVDLSDDIVQVEFSGAGTLSLVLDGPTGPAPPANYNQSTTYMKGHAGIVLTGANATTNLSVFSVGRLNAANQALFRNDVTYDGFADIAFIAITSTDGKFGGLRTANASYFATKGLTGVYAPGVEFTDRVLIGDIRAADDATPVIIIGSCNNTQINGGDLFQSNGRAVQVSGLSQLRFVAGSSSHGPTFNAQTNRGRLEQNGVDVTSSVVVNP